MQIGQVMTESNEPMQWHTATRDDMWQAVASRDEASNGRFVFAVRSTGIYCKPSCPSRRPKPENVQFFNLPEAAEASGYRACLRCKPRDVQAKDPRVAMVSRVCRILERADDEQTPNLEMLAEKVGSSPYHLQRTFKKVVGISPREYTEALRLNRFKAKVKEGESVTTAIYDSGYGSSSRLYEKSTSHLGMTPAEYGRGGGQGMLINFTVVECPLGLLLVAATEKGVCSVTLGDSVEELTRDLEKEFSAARLERDDELLGEWTAAIVKHLEGVLPHLALPLDIRATAFQRRVWEELQKIPYGSTRSYAAVAEAIGRPSAVRAVARACATNPVALVVPCHRVVREDGSMGGYRWGIQRKKRLIESEKVTATN
jgi:AraC family transcriptional regulator of adaptative response/methylated-DNA-[protein]-cysteine methyltransferase